MSIQLIVRANFCWPRPLLSGSLRRQRFLVAVAAAFLPFVIPETSMEVRDDGACSFHMLVSLAQLLFRSARNACADFLEDGTLQWFGDIGREVFSEDLKCLFVSFILFSERSLAHGLGDFGDSFLMRAAV